MKIQVRRGVFETNSSSTHSISISKEVPNMNDIQKEIDFVGGEFGWMRCIYTNSEDKLSYLFTALQYHDKGVEYFEKIKGYLDEAGIKYTIDENYAPHLSKDADRQGMMDFDFRDPWMYYIDHGDETFEFVDDVVNDKDLFFSYVFGDSSVTTGNDNSEFYPDGDRIGDNYYHYFKGN